MKYESLEASQLKPGHCCSSLSSCSLVLERLPGNITVPFHKVKGPAWQGEFREAIPILRVVLKMERSPYTHIVL